MIQKITLIVCLLACSFAFSQTEGGKEMEKFKKDLTGYIITIGDASNKFLRVNFVDSENSRFINAPVLFSDKTTLKKAANLFAYEQLRPGMKFKMDALLFDKQGHYEALKITIQEVSDASASISKGRLDFVSPDYVIVDGNRIKMGKGKINGADGYEHRKDLPDFSPLVEGDIVDASGKYKDGIYSASKFEFSPREIKNWYVDSIDQSDYEALKEVWFNPARRHEMFNVAVDNVGLILNDEKIQDYVQKLGTSLVPKHVQNEIKFIFVVVDNPASNAFVKPNGLAYVYAGLLAEVQNEAQLAGILAHEIAHAMYEHGLEEAKDINRKKKPEKYFSFLRDKGKEVSSKKLKKAASKKDVKGELAGQYIDEGLDILFVDAPDAYFTARLSSYDKQQELQADRVGLALAASQNYNPIEIAAFWANQYDSYGEIPKSGQWFYKMREAIAIHDASKSDKKATNDAMKVGKEAGTVARVGIEYLKQSKGDTHPKYEKRFEELNRLIEMYWSDPDYLKNTKTGETEYNVVRNNLASAIKRTGESKKKIGNPSGSGKGVKPKKGGK